MRIEHWLYTIPLRLRSLFQRRRVEEELNEELQCHLEQKTQEYIAQGVPADEARRDMDGLEQQKEECRDMRGVGFIEDFVKDVRFGIRQLRRNPGFTIVAVITLALGIGANATIFSFINALLLRPPSGVESPNQLVSVWNRLPDGHSMQLSYPEYVYFRKHSDVFSGLLAYSSDPDQVSWTRSGQSRLILARLVSANYFSLLGVQPMLGRGFLPGEDKEPGRQPVAVISHSFWER
jgi:hypothetical protein